VSARARLAATRRWVVKVGSSLVTARGQGLDHAAIADWCAQIAALRAQGKEVVMVSSGAVAEGMARLGLRKRPGTLHELQAAAAVADGPGARLGARLRCARPQGRADPADP
jgi:glutamate 5-kinase